MKTIVSLSCILISTIVTLYVSSTHAEITFYNNSDGTSGTATKIGNFTFYNDNKGNSVTANQIGDFTFYNDNKGNSATANQIGNFTFVNGNNGYSGTANQIGNMTFYNDNRGNSATATRLGNTTFVNGNNINGSVQRFGNNAQVNVQQNSYARRDETSYSDSDDTDYYQPRNTVVQQNNGGYAKRQTNYSQPQRQTSSYARQTSSKGDDLSLGDSPVLNTSVSAIYLSREEVELASGDTIKFLSKSKQTVRSWRNNDTILVYEVKSNGFVIGYQLYNANRKSSAFGTPK